MTIRDWPVAERPRERLLEKGAASLSDAELLAIFLRVGVQGQSAVEMARGLLQRFGGLRGLLTASAAEFCAERGLGMAKYAQLQAVLEMGRRHMAENWHRGEALDSPRRVAEYLRLILRDRSREVFLVLFLDNRHRVLRFEELFQGTIDAASVYVREVAKRALGAQCRRPHRRPQPPVGGGGAQSGRPPADAAAGAGSGASGHPPSRPFRRW
ncbi:DNA repair protein RadC [Acidithiobacillus caldus ATCC 51756]|uniref:DNA repair protein RadC n=1 Tax=Acidithiobacillus caldus (strain ATCC 51756 / DSM 8584 / KU) TaxID=637389 RepID=A0A060A1T7_ACICK|nr:DNA repair protein RadC [Acidithiobacillus caldus ATCC 51756]